MLVFSHVPTLCVPMDCSPLGYCVHGILQARILEWVTMPFSRGSSWPRDRTQATCIAGRFFTIWAIRKAHRPKVCLISEQRKDSPTSKTVPRLRYSDSQHLCPVIDFTARSQLYAPVSTQHVIFSWWGIGDMARWQSFWEAEGGPLWDSIEKL